MVVLPEHVEAPVAGEDGHGVETGCTADIESPAVVPEPSFSNTRAKPVLKTGMSPEEKTTYSVGDSPYKSDRQSR